MFKAHNYSADLYLSPWHWNLAVFGLTSDIKYTRWAKPNSPDIRGMLPSRIPSNACAVSVGIGSRLVSQLISTQPPVYFCVFSLFFEISAGYLNPIVHFWFILWFQLISNIPRQILSYQNFFYPLPDECKLNGSGSR